MASYYVYSPEGTEHTFPLPVTTGTLVLVGLSNLVLSGLSEVGVDLVVIGCTQVEFKDSIRVGGSILIDACHNVSIRVLQTNKYVVQDSLFSSVTVRRLSPKVPTDNSDELSKAITLVTKVIEGPLVKSLNGLQIQQRPSIRSVMVARIGGMLRLHLV